MRGILIVTPRAELPDALDMDAQGLELLPDDAFRHLPAEVFDQQKYTTVLWERESVKTHTLSPIRGSEGTDCGSEAVGIPRHDHQSLALHLGRQTAGT